MQTQIFLIQFAGLLHFAILLASALVPHVLDWKKEQRGLSPMSRHLIWVHGVFIVLVIVAFGTICLVNSSQLSNGSALARSVCGFIAVFWAARLAVQLFLFDPRAYLHRILLRLGYHGLTIVFTFIATVMAWAALVPTIVY